MPTEVQEEPNNRLAEVMENSTAVVMLRMQGLPGNRQVPNAEISVGGQSLERKLFSTPTMRLMPTEWSKKFNQLHTEAERIVRSASPPKSETNEMPLPIGCHLIAGPRKTAIAAAIEDLTTNTLIPLRNAFCDAYPSIVTELRAKLNSEATWQRMEHRIPSAAQLRASIAIKFVVLPFTFLNEAGRAMAEEVAQSIIAGISETIEEEAIKLREKITKEGVFKEGSFTKLKQQFQSLRDFSFLATEDTLTALAEAEKATSGADLASQLNTNIKVGGSIATTLRDVVAKLAEETKTDAGGRFRRRINI